jgi:beta-glucosidase
MVLAENPASKPVQNTAITPEARGGGCLKQHKAMNERLAKGNVDLIFLGDSITKGWRSRGKGEEVWQEYYADRNAIGMGISGDRTQHVLWRLENSDFRNVSPKLVVLMIGVNNFPSRNTPEEIIAGITKVVEKLREKLPKTHILLMSVCRGHNVKDKDNSPQKVAVEINQQIRKLEKDENVTFVDLAQKMMQPDGTTPKDLLRDGVHPTQKGYYAWAELIEPYVEKYVGKKKSPKKTLQTAPLEKGFTRLFDGKTLDGWHAEGGTALYAVENGCIVGIVDKKSKMNSFLSTDKNYGDFVLKLDAKFGDPACNSGIQIRSHARKDGRVYGYQCELDPGDRAWTGGIYDEARRGWLYKLDGEKHAAARKAFKRNDWNSIEIRAEGNSITTRVNGVPCADLTDDKDASGFIGLQVHTGKKGSVMWRNIRIKELK